MELVAYTGSAEAVRAAVVNGADAVRVGFCGFSSFASSFEPGCEEYFKAAEYCRIRGVKIYLSFNLPLHEGKFSQAVGLVTEAYRRGADAVCSGDIGFLKALRQLLPDVPLHADVTAGVYDSTGVSLLSSLGITRILLPPQLSRSLVRQIRSRNPEQTELETSCYGPQCIAYGGTCRMGAFTSKAAAAGPCSRPCNESCTLNAGTKADGYRLKLKDLSLASYLTELPELGINAVSITGADRRPEFTAMAVGMFRRALDGGKAPSAHDLSILNEIFSPSGNTAGFYEGKLGEEMLDIKKPSPRTCKSKAVLATVKSDYMNGDSQRVPVQMYAELRRGSSVCIAAADGKGNTAGAAGPVPEGASSGKRELTSAILKTQLYNTLGTPYLCAGVKTDVEPGLYLPSADISLVRKEALSRLTEMRKTVPVVSTGRLPEIIKYEGNKGKPDLTFSVLKASQLSSQLAGTKPKVLYIPLGELKASPSSITPFWENGVTSICAVLPPIVTDTNAIEVYRELYSLKELHIDEVMISSLSQLTPAQVLGFKIRGGLNLNVSNSHTLKALKEQGLISAVLSPALRLEQLKQISKYIDTELPAYGRLPLMVTENCVIKCSAGVCACEGTQNLCDRHGRLYPLARAEGCRSVLYSPDKLFLANRLIDFEDLGLWCLNLAFTTENAKECISVAGRYLQLNKYEPNAKTKGLYYA